MAKSITAVGPTALRTFTFPDANATMLTSATPGLSFDPTTKYLSVGQVGNTIAALAVNPTLPLSTTQFGLNVIPTFTFVGSSTEATAIRGQVTLAASVAKGASAGLVIEAPQVGAGGSFVEYYSGIFRGAHGVSGITFAVSLSVETSADRTLWVGTDTNGTTWQSGITFGSSSDTNLYRSAANTLKTDDSLVVAGSILAVGGTTSSDPAMRKNGTTLEFILADASAYARIKARVAFLDAVEGNITAPGTPADGQWWVDFTGVTPNRQLRLAIRDGGVTYTQNVGAAH